MEAVKSDDGTPAIDSLGADRADCDAWQAVLFDVLQKLPIWKQRGLQRYGTSYDATASDADLDEDDLADLDDLDDDDLDPETCDEDRVTPLSTI